MHGTVLTSSLAPLSFPPSSPFSSLPSYFQQPPLPPMALTLPPPHPAILYPSTHPHCVPQSPAGSHRSFNLPCAFYTSSQLQCPCVVQFLGACVDLDSRECVILNELMSRGSLDSVLHVDKIPLDWNTRLGIVSTSVSISYSSQGD